MSFWNPFSWKIDKTAELKKELSEDGKEKYKEYLDFPIEINTEIDLEEKLRDEVTFYVEDGEVKFNYTLQNSENFSAILSTIYNKDRMREVLDALVIDLDEKLQEKTLDNIQFLILTLGHLTHQLYKSSVLVKPSEYEP